MCMCVGVGVCTCRPSGPGGIREGGCSSGANARRIKGWYQIVILVLQRHHQFIIIINYNF